MMTSFGAITFAVAAQGSSPVKWDDHAALFDSFTILNNQQQHAQTTWF